jgi:phytoene dehydrogenase-like protein
MPLLYPNLVEATKLTIGSWLDKYITNEELKLDLTAHLAYWSDDPYKLSLFYFGLPFSGFVKNGGHFIKGGSQQLSSYLASYIENNGGTVLLGKKAEKIITENGKVKAVRFKDSFNKQMKPVTITCDNVVANCAIPIVPELLDEPHASKLKVKINNHTDSCSLLCMYLGFKTEVDQFGVKHYSNYIRGEDVKSLKDLLPNNMGDWSTRSFIFVDYNKVDSALAPPGKSEGVICAVDYLEQWEDLNDEDYKAKKERIATTLLQRLDKQFPGIRESIEYYEVSTPKTVKRYTSNPSGSVYGYAQSKEQTASKRFRNNFLIPNLYFASAWAFPGGGFEGSITGGFLAALQMNKDKIWSQPEVETYTDNRIAKLSKSKVTEVKTIELQFEKHKDLDHQKGQYAILKLKNPKETELDLPYRWLRLSSNGDDNTIKFAVEQDGSSFSKSCAMMEEGEKALILGPM